MITHYSLYNVSNNQLYTWIKTIVMQCSKHAYYICLWSLLCEIDQLNMIPMMLISKLCINPLLITKHKSHNDLRTKITKYSIGDQLYGNEVSYSKYIALNILLALSFLILHRLNNFHLWRHFHIPILTITSEKELPLFRICQYGLSKINTILPTILEKPIFGKP